MVDWNFERSTEDGVDATVIMMSAYGQWYPRLKRWNWGLWLHSSPLTDEIVLILKKQKKGTIKKKNELLRKEVQKEYSFKSIVIRMKRCRKYSSDKKVRPISRLSSSRGRVEREGADCEALHYSSDRSKLPHSINCGAIPETLWSELFVMSKGFYRCHPTKKVSSKSGWDALLGWNRRTAFTTSG